MKWKDWLSCKNLLKVAIEVAHNGSLMDKSCDRKFASNHKLLFLGVYAIPQGCKTKVTKNLRY